MGLLLFLLYVNAIANVSDYTNVFYHDNDILNAQHVINSDLKVLALWLRINKLSLHLGKTNYMLFKPRKKLCRY